MKILLTGAAGFIGFHLTIYLLEKGHDVSGVDSINNYYDPQLKLDRLSVLGIDTTFIQHGKFVQSSLYPLFKFVKLNIANSSEFLTGLSDEQYDFVIHLAAQAGVRYSISNPNSYIENNLVAFSNILEYSRNTNIQHLIYASSSSVYGNNTEVPFRENSSTDQPVSLYAATKKSNELMACSYSHLYGIPVTGLRFFTVYGPW
jgi:UDP-glucuronate 4-epimerase